MFKHAGLTFQPHTSSKRLIWEQLLSQY